jgi:hypothetical protein
MLLYKLSNETCRDFFCPGLKIQPAEKSGPPAISKSLLYSQKNSCIAVDFQAGSEILSGKEFAFEFQSALTLSWVLS